MTAQLRIMDSGLRGPRDNLSVTEALCRLHREGRTIDTLRFQHFPPSAIIGRHQLLHREVNLEWVAAHGVQTARRMTGGGAIVMGPGILGWELIVARDKVPAQLAAVSSTICEGVATGLRRLGVEAVFRPRNDIEIAGRKVSGTGGYFDGGTLVFQGTVLIELDADLLTNALNLPAHKLGKRGLESLKDRVGDLASFLGEAPDMEAVQAAVRDGISAALGLAPVHGSLTAEEEDLAHRVFESEIGTEGFVTGADDHPPSAGHTLRTQRQTPGGTLDLVVKVLDGEANRCDQVLIAGDFFASPPKVITDLEAHLRHRPLEALADEAMRFLADRGAVFLGMEAAEIGNAFRDVLAQASEKRA